MSSNQVARKRDLSGNEYSSLHRPHPFASENVSLVDQLAQKDVFEIASQYERGEWSCERLDEVMFHLFSRKMAPTTLGHFKRIARYVLRDLLVDSRRGDGAYDIAHGHYNLGNDLFSVMLDSSMSYTCGYWARATTLEEAQYAKLDLLCKKLHLSKGMKVLDIGCGWGNFAKYAAEQYGVSVVGLTVSEQQASLARKRCKGLPVEIRIEDYRNCTDVFDRIVSIEMIEAVGRRNLGVYFDMVTRCLKDGGLFALESISSETMTTKSSRVVDQFFMWIERYIFPKGYVPRIDELVAPGRDQLMVEDVHNFGPDYDLTLMAWAEQFEAGWSTLSKRYDENFHRRWRFYLLACAGLFRSRYAHLYQIVYSKGPRPESYHTFR